MPTAATHPTGDVAPPSLPVRALRSVRQHGVWTAAQRSFWAAAGAVRERRLGIQTRGSIRGEHLSSEADNFGYQPIPYRSFDVAMRHIDLRPHEDVFLDYGCGKGRAVVLAALRPFRRVLGVELNEALAADAGRNLARSRNHHRCGGAEIVRADARRYALPDDASVLFFFNPFDEPIMRDVLARIRESLERRRRTLQIIYALPRTRRDLVADQSWLERAHDLKTIYSDWQRLAIYRTRSS